MFASSTGSTVLPLGISGRCRTDAATLQGAQQILAHRCLKLGLQKHGFVKMMLHLSRKQYGAANSNTVLLSRVVRQGGKSGQRGAVRACAGDTYSARAAPSKASPYCRTAGTAWPPSRPQSPSAPTSAPRRTARHARSLNGAHSGLGTSVKGAQQALDVAVTQVRFISRSALYPPLRPKARHYQLI